MLGSFNKTYEEKVRLGGFLKSLNQNSWQQFSFAASSWLYEVLCRSNPFPDAVSVYELPVTWKVGRDVSGRVGLISLQLLETELVPFSKKKKKSGGEEWDSVCRRQTNKQENAAFKKFAVESYAQSTCSQ